MLNRDLIKKYITRILTIKEFISKDSLKEDKLVISLTTQKIKDPKLLENLFQSLSTDKLLSIFGDDMNNLMSFILKLDYVDDQFKETLIIKIATKYLGEGDYLSLFDVLIGPLMKNEKGNARRRG